MTTQPLLLPLSDTQDLALVGGKAINLARLINAGFPVPDGFVVTTAAWREFADLPHIPDQFVEEIREAYARMGSPLVAARSSATAEDLAQASMAGQYETYLNLSHADALVEAIARCWKSLKAERIQVYLREHDIDPTQVAMAVVVQRQIASESAGVLFTANPKNGAHGEMLIEAAWGLGEAVVSGEVQPDLIHLVSHDASVLDYQVATKTQRLLPGGAGFEPVPETLQNKACLTYPQIHELWRLGRLAADHFQCPQDLEWAVAEGKVYLLQSRAITTLDESRAYHDLLEQTREYLTTQSNQSYGPWVRHNLSETLPHPTQLTWGILRPFMSGDGGFGHMYRLLGYQPSPEVCREGFLDLLAGQIYMDCARMPEMIAEGFPFAYDVERLRDNPDAAQQPPTIPTGNLKDQAIAAKLSTKVTRNLIRLAEDLDRKFDNDFVPQLQAWCAEIALMDFEILDDESLIERWQQDVPRVMDDFGMQAFLPSMVEGLATAQLHAFLDEYIWDEDPDELVQQLSVSATPDRTMLSNIHLQQVAEGTRTVDQWLIDHGHRAPGEFDLSVPRWRERPGDLANMADHCHDASGQHDFHQLHDQRLEATQACLQRLKSILPAAQARALDQHVDLLQRYCRFREDGKYYLMLAYEQLRRLALEFGRRLQINDDVFHLSPDEMTDALRTGFVPLDRIDRRRLTYNAETRIKLPHVIDAESLAILGQPAVTNGHNQWKAHPVSCGACTGTARIVLNPEEAGDLGSDYILVCPSTDPCWTPLFAMASGVILERGGSLSHGAVVARELGLPAVVLDGATSLFSDGEQLSIDGNHGSISRGDAEDLSDDRDEDQLTLTRPMLPPAAGAAERKADKIILAFTALWAVFFTLVYVLPPTALKEPVFHVIDLLLWPLVPRIGLVWTVAAAGAFFAVLLLVGQRLLTDNHRLREVKQRAKRLRKRVAKLPADDPIRQQAEQACAPVTRRTLKAALVPLAVFLGPMILVFLWFPERVDPAVRSAEAGRTVSIVAELDGDHSTPVTLALPEPLELDASSQATQSLPPIRAELETLRTELQVASDMKEYPWELQKTAEQTRAQMLASLNTYLAGGVPAQKLSWMVQVPTEVNGSYPVQLEIENQPPVQLSLVFGQASPPAPSETLCDSGPVHSLSAVYQRSLTKPVFWSPLPHIGGPDWDFGWLGVYILSYLFFMIVAKSLLRVP